MKDRHSPLIVLATIAMFSGTVVLALSIAPSPVSAQDGQALFNGLCSACHSIGGGVVVGPDLEGVTERRTEEWLVPFIRSSSTVIESGDETALELFAEFEQSPMPDVSYSEAEILAVLRYIESGGDGSGGSGYMVSDRPATAADIELGSRLFQGTTRLENRGPACTSCHDVQVQDDMVIGGGVLARELTTVFSDMGRNRSTVGGRISESPFAVMGAAYADRPITDAEIFAIVAFLEDADAQEEFQRPGDYGVKLLQGGVGGFLVLMLLYGLMWRKRKQRSVNQDIYDRQVKSQ